jgi:hypothetical protein
MAMDLPRVKLPGEHSLELQIAAHKIHRSDLLAASIIARFQPAINLRFGPRKQVSGYDKTG